MTVAVTGLPAETFGGHHHSLVYIWDVPTLTALVWDGSLATGALTIGKVNQGTAGTSDWLVKSGLGIPAHDYVGLTYTGSNLTTVAYKTGGAAGSTVATLTLAYTGSRLDTVTKS